MVDISIFIKNFFDQGFLENYIRIRWWISINRALNLMVWIVVSEMSTTCGPCWFIELLGRRRLWKFYIIWIVSYPIVKISSIFSLKLLDPMRLRIGNRPRTKLGWAIMSNLFLTIRKANIEVLRYFMFQWFFTNRQLRWNILGDNFHRWWVSNINCVTLGADKSPLLIIDFELNRSVYWPIFLQFVLTEIFLIDLVEIVLSVRFSFLFLLLFLGF